MSWWGYGLLGTILLYCGCGGFAENIDVTIHSGNVGQAVSYNYPFTYEKADYITYNYKIFSNNQFAKWTCLTFHRFDMRNGGTLEIDSEYGSGTYHKTGIRDSVSSSKAGEVFPSTVWDKPFCVPLKYDMDHLEVTFRHVGHSIQGFQFDYVASSKAPKANIEQIYPTPQGSYEDEFHCYDLKKAIPWSRTCDYDVDCEDASDETFAHAQCTGTGLNSGRPKQGPGIWACNFDSGACSSDMYIGSVWKFASSVAPGEDGPRTDHTFGSSGQGMFIYTDTGYGYYLRFNPNISSGRDYCLSFWYFMTGIDPGKLSVRWRYSDQLWQRIGSHGNKWLQGQVNLKSDSYSKIEIAAERGSNEDSRISLDDISVLPGLCPYTDGGFTAPGWDFDDCKAYYSSRTNYIRCNMEKDESVIISPMIASGKCFVLSVRFPDSVVYPQPTVVIFQNTLGKPSEYLGEIKNIDHSIREETKKYDINSVNPFKIQLKLASDQGKYIDVDNFYVVDNDCNNLSLGSCSSYQFYCSEVQCISSYKKCDGIRDCSNGRDEKDCIESFPGVTVATGLIGACIFILMGLTCILYSINKRSTQRNQEARARRNEQMSIRGQVFSVEHGTNQGFSFDDPDNLPPSYTDLVADGIVVPGGPSEGQDTTDSTSLPPYDDFLTGSFVELNPTTLKPVNKPDEQPDTIP